MASRKTWLWVVLGLAGAGAVSLVTVAGVGLYVFNQHIQSHQSTSAEAQQAFEAVKATFREQRPLYELDASDRPRMTRPLSDLPTSPSTPEALWVLAWDPDEHRLVKISLPLWMLRFGHQKIGAAREGDFDFERLDLDAAELRRIGPALVFEFKSREGSDVLLWTQ